MKLSAWIRYANGRDPLVFAMRDLKKVAVGCVERTHGGVTLCTTPAGKPVRLSRLVEVAKGADLDIHIEINGKISSVDEAAGGGGWITGDEMTIVAC